MSIYGRCIGCFHDFAEGPCGGCGAEAETAPASPPVSAATLAMRERRARLAAEGLCIICAKAPAVEGPRGGKRYCDACRESLSEINARRRGKAASAKSAPAPRRKPKPKPEPAPRELEPPRVPMLRDRLRMARMRDRGELLEVQS